MTTSDLVSYECIRNDDLSTKQKEMLKSPDKVERQREFLRLAAADEQSGFCRYFLSIGLEGSELCNTIPKFTSSEFLEPPWELELTLSNELDALSPSVASMPGFWARFCIQSVQEGRVHPSTFAEESRSSKDINGKARIRQALRENNESDMEACVRRIFRVMGGILSDRGHRTTFLDCPLAKSWWRHHIASGSAELLEHQSHIKDYSDSLRPSHIWNTLLQHIVSKQTIVGFPKVLAAIVDEIARLTQTEKTNEQIVRRKLSAVGNQCANQALDLLVIDDVIDSLFGREKWLFITDSVE